MNRMTWAVALAAPVLAGILTGGASGTEPSSTFDQRWQHPAPAAAAAPSAQQQPQRTLPVSLEQSLYLIRSTLLTLNDANRSGNYTVLRDLAAPDFQARNSPADLAGSFSDLRTRKFDLFAVALAAPQLTATPALDANGMLRLAAAFPTRPLRIDFDLLFQNVGGQWRLYGIAVATPQAPAQTAATNPPIKKK